MKSQSKRLASFRRIFFIVCAAANSAWALPNSLGTFSIGHMETSFVDSERDNRSIDIDIWYPASVDDQDALTSYRMARSVDFAFPSSRAHKDPIIETGRFPLLISSHGTTLFSTSQATVNESLASHGFVVVALNHTGNSRNDAILGTAVPEEGVAVERIHDVRLAIDRMLESANRPGDRFESSIDPEKIGVLGLSYGGVTTFASHLGAMGIEGDPRIQAIMPMTSGGFSWMNMNSSDLMSAIPTLLLNGTQDRTRSDSIDAFNYISSQNRYLAEIVDAKHLSYTEVCSWRDYAIEQEAPAEIMGYLNAVAGGNWKTCDADVIDNDLAIELTGQLAVSFFRGHLNDEEEFLSYLTDDFFRNSQFPVRFIEKGDFNRNGSVGVEDIDRLSSLIRRGSSSRRYDIDRDGIVDANDRDQLIHIELNTYFGDSNLDSEFNSGDLVAVFQAGEYEDELTDNSTWATGDWNGDAEFDSADFIVSFQEGSFEQGPNMFTATVVPEPKSAMVWLLGCTIAIVMFRRHA